MISNKPVNAVQVTVDVNQGLVVGENHGNIYNYGNATKMPSLIADIVKAMANVDECNPKNPIEPSVLAFKPDEKIKYNSVVKYKEIITEHATYYSQCEEILNILDDSNIGTKSKILRCVRNWYLEAKGDVLINKQSDDPQNIDIIRMCSDDLIDKVKERIFAVARNYAQPDTSVEEVELGVVCFTCYCFMECRILEKPLW